MPYCGTPGCSCMPKDEEEEKTMKTDAEIIADIVAGTTSPQRALDRVKDELGVSDDVREFAEQGREPIDHDAFEDHLLNAYPWDENPEHNVKIALAVYRPDLLLAPGIDDEYKDLTALKARVEQEMELRKRAEKEKEELRIRRDLIESLLCGLVFQVTKNKLQAKLDQGSFLDTCRAELLKSTDPTIVERSIDVEEVYMKAKEKLARALNASEFRLIKERGL